MARVDKQPLLARVNVIGFFGVVVSLLLWELVVTEVPLAAVKRVPSALAVARAIPGVVSSSAFWSAILHTTWVTVVSWMAAAVIGLSLGMLLGLVERVSDWSLASIDFVRSLPSIAFVPVALLIFGQSPRMELAIAIYASCWIVVVTAARGFRTSSGIYRDTGATLGLKRSAMIWKVIIPSASAQAIVGLRLALGTCLVLTIVAEMVGNPAGIGGQITLLLNASRNNEMFVYIVAAGALGISLNAVFGVAVRAFPFGGLRTVTAT